MVRKLSVDKKAAIDDILQPNNRDQVSGSIYPELYNKLDSQMSAIANKVLNKNWQLSLRFNFNRIKP